MKVYTVTSGTAHTNMSFEGLFDNKSASGPRIMASLSKMPGPFERVTEGAMDTLDLEDNHDGRALMVAGLQSCTAVFYLYMKPNTHTISAALAFHSPSGGLNINVGRELRGPIAEAVTVDRKNVVAKNVYVLMAAGPSTMSAHDKQKGNVEEYTKAAIEEHESLIGLLDKEHIPTEHRVIYCSAGGQFALSASGFLGEPAPVKK
jgi:hypothetical protein